MSSKKLVKQLEGQLWYPAIGWQVLRRSKRYKAAFNRFLTIANAAEGDKGLSEYAVEFAALPQNQEIQNSRLAAAEKSGSTPLRVRVHDEGIESLLFGSPDIDPPQFDYLMYTPYCENFLKEFGFALRFPIRPNEVKPNPSVFVRV